MASAGVRYDFANGESIAVSVTGKTSYPDALSELRHTAAALFVEAMRDAFGVKAVVEDSSEPEA